MLKKPARVRLSDVAEAANTSVATVSMALGGSTRISNATRRRVQQLCRELGYRPRRALPAALKNTAQLRDNLRLAFFVVGRMDRPVHIAILESLTRVADANDARLELASVTPETPSEKIVAKAIQVGREVDGMLLTGAITTEHLWQIADASIPAVIYGYPAGEFDEELPMPVITSDFVGIGHRATRALIETGQRRIAFISGPLAPGGWHARCLDGYAMAHYHARLPVDEAMVSSAESSAGEDSGAVGAAAMLALPPERRPTAYVVINPGTASRFLATMREAGATVQRDRLVICGYSDLAHDLGVDEYPLVYMDTTKIADAAMNQLKNECIRRSECSTTVLVPFSVRGLATAARSLK